MKKITLKVSLISCILTLFVAYSLFAVEVVKPVRDNRLYRVITLPNQLEAILVSDKELKQTAVSLSVWAGYNLDPKDRPGLFHFMEHMLFLGTQKYPSSKAYGDYLNANGGTFNAFTSAEQTNYFFSVNSNAIAGALDRFSQFFISPLFDETFVNREMHAVDSEHSKNMTSDLRRIIQVTKATVNPAHPYANFGTGNLETLSNKKGEKVMDVLKEHFNTYYSANLMKVGMVGNQSLDEMEKQVRHYFSPIKNKNTQIPPNPVSPFTKEYLKKRIEIEPLKNIRRLNVYFPIPSQIPFYKEKPIAFISRILGYEGEGSLFSLLKKKNWANSLSAGGNSGGTDFETLAVTISLTMEGLKHQDEIIEMIFQAIQLIKSDGVKKRYFDEEQKLSRIRFEYVTKSSPLNYAKTLAIRLQEYPAEDLLSLMVLKKWNAPQIKDILEQLTPDNMRVELVSKTAKTSKLEKWYGTPYSMMDIPKEKLDRWRTVSLNSELTLPLENLFIPEAVGLKRLEKSIKTPEIIFQKPALTIWHKQDNKFESPEVKATFKLNSPVVSASPKTKLLTVLYTSLLKDALNEYTYPALEAGLNYGVRGSQSGLEIELSGYPEKMLVLFQTVIDKMKTLQVESERFSTLFENIKRSLKNHSLQESRVLNGYEFNYLLSRDGWHVSDLLKTIDSIDEKEVQAFIPVLLSGLTGEGLIYGNMVKTDALKLIHVLESGLMNDMNIPSISDLNRTIRLEENQPILFQQKVKDVNSSIITYYQHGPETNRTRAIQGLMGTMISRPFYNQLRTREQLGYVVYGSIANHNTVNGFQFTVQSSIKDPVYLEERIEQFLKTHQRALDSTSKGEFETFRQALIKRLLLPAKNLKEQNMLYWRQISSQRYNFAIYEEIATELKNITLKDLSSYYKKMFFEDGKKISVQSFGASHPIRISPQIRAIEDPKIFKRRASYYGIVTTTRENEGGI